MSTRSGSVILATVMAVGLVLSGCADGSETERRSTAGSSTTSAPSDALPSDAAAPQSADPSVSTAPTTDYTQAAATGQVVRLPGVRLAGPLGWPSADKVDPDSNAAALISEDFLQTIRIGSQNLGGGDTLKQLADSYVRFSGFQRKQKRLAPVTVAGQEWFHVAGQTDPTQRAETFGTTTSAGDEITIIFEYLLEVPKAQREETTGSVLASVRLG